MLSIWTCDFDVVVRKICPESRLRNAKRLRWRMGSSSLEISSKSKIGSICASFLRHRISAIFSAMQSARC